MVWIAGADGCKAGWFRVSLETQSRDLQYLCAKNVRDLFQYKPHPSLLGLDIPIGLPEKGNRKCDLGARALLHTNRKSSVFPAPIRAALNARTYEEACGITKQKSGKKISKQTFFLFPKIKEVDQFLQQKKGYRKDIIEVHPEVSFWKWAGRTMEFSKKKKSGKEERLHLISKQFGSEALERARAALNKEKFRKKDVADDDILDAYAALWTAERCFQGIADVVPEHGEEDPTSLPMQIVY
tara:strand:+ start:191 stop:910 length:720 start_codon:yes stop_codon:yes gene_type:complete